MDRLKNKVAIVTGAYGGIGLATSKLFLQEGAKVVLVGRDERKLATAARELESFGDLRICPADVADKAQSQKYVDLTVREFGRVDVYFANAGVEGTMRPLVDYPDDEFRKVLETNVMGVWYGLKAVVPAMRKTGGGSIVITSSVLGLKGSPGTSGYSASKHAVMGLAKSLALEEAQNKIRVNTVNPGPVDNRMMLSLETAAAPDAPGAVRDQITKAIPLGRYGQNEEVARLVLFLSSDESSYCTGESFRVDGGMLA
ncbi:MAG: SDR family NAD(P)-dependent oxidoreductase [Bdellovibrionia bacterium]